MTSCNNSQMDKSIEYSNEIHTMNVSQGQDTLLQKEKDTSNSAPQITTVKTNNKKQITNKKQSQPPRGLLNFLMTQILMVPQ